MRSISQVFPQLFTVKEVAQIFRLTEGAIRRMVRAKEIPAIRIGKEYRISGQVLQNILHPLSDQNLKEAAFGLWKTGKSPEGSKWVRTHRDTDVRSLNELLKDLED